MNDPPLSILVLNWRDVTHPSAGGAETYLHELAKRWVRAGHRVTWVTARYAGAAPRARIDGIDIVRVGNAVTVYALAPLFCLWRLRGEFDVAVDSENGIPFYAPLFTKRPVVCVMHHVHREVFRRHLPALVSEAFVWAETWLMPRLYRRARFVAVSEQTKAEMASFDCSAQDVAVVYNGVDAAIEPGPKAEVPTILYLGRLKRYKRVDLLLDAFVRIRERISNATLIIAGTGDAGKGLAEHAQRLGIGAAVTFAGFVRDETKRELLARAWVFVNPSEMEGWGIGVIEANAARTPAIAFRVPGLSESIDDGVSGLLVDDDDQLVDAVSRTLTDRSLRERLAAGALSRARDFSWDASAARLLAILKQCVAEAPARRRLASPNAAARRRLENDLGKGA